MVLWSPLVKKNTLLNGTRLCVSGLWLCALTACGGSSGVDSVDTISGGPSAEDQAPTEINAGQNIQQDDVPACEATFDTAELLFTEVDRQWSCEIPSGAASTYSELYFSRDGTAVFSDNGNWFWNRKLPGDAIGLASLSKPSQLITDVRSTNTLVNFTVTSESGQSRYFECVLVSRETSS